jgi:hypothetical protein
MATSKIGSNIDRTARQILDRRSQIWKDYDRTLSETSELNRYASIYGNANITEKIAPLTSENTPSTEIFATIAKIKEQEAIIGGANAELKSTLAKIKTLETQGKGCLLLLIIVVLLIIAVVLVMRSLK